MASGGRWRKGTWSGDQVREAAEIQARGAEGRPSRSHGARSEGLDSRVGGDHTEQRKR